MEKYDLGEFDSGMIPHSDGDWVRYDEAQQEIESLRSQVEILRVTCDAHISVIEDTEKEKDEWKRLATILYKNTDKQDPIFELNPEITAAFED